MEEGGGGNWGRRLVRLPPRHEVWRDSNALLSQIG
jgi:hypothetical protein